MTIELLKRAGEVGGEAALVLLFRSEASTGKMFEDRIPPLNPAIDTLECDFHLLYGRADLVISHADHSITVIIARDGARGHEHVAAGIGVASLCAAQLALMRPTAEIRKALLWASAGQPLLDGVVEAACEAANVIPLSWSTMAVHLADAEKSVNQFLSGAAHRADVHLDAKGIH
ncbi:hypothetical protein FB547_1097 [Variovorax beijingensis]|uniref:Uncharacterized protein n=1 Tax=Variovorax beijingensis TaxID=2496117 RepID=A0A561BF31_9BURK|nr:hypothetical protein [Variovorax beijingensis]TWD77473.1 hypothetical protein FB547_1097 [Variovorax beijingensis]